MNEQIRHPGHTYPQAFELKELVGVLSSMRMRQAGKRHKGNICRVLSASAPKPDQIGWRELDQVLPPRKQWRRPGRRRSRIGKHALRRSLFNTLKPYQEPGGPDLRDCQWGRNLLELLDHVQRMAEETSPRLKTPYVRTIPKGNGGTRILRYSTEFTDVVFLKLLNRYLTRLFDPLLGPEVLAFRSREHDPRGKAVKRIRALRAKEQTLYVGEVDIQSFFDGIPQREVRAALNQLISEHAVIAHPCALGWVEQFLSQMPADPETGQRRGLPQGGVLSPLLCNLVMHAADQAVMEPADKGLCYLRYCDDVVFLHQNKEECRKAIDRYLDALKRLGLEAHIPVSLDEQPHAFALAKSRYPYRWSDETEDPNSHPWLGFLGYEIHASGDVRVRPSSMKRHQQALDKELGMMMNLMRNPRNDNEKSFLMIRGYLIHKALGRQLAAEFLPFVPHWASAFRELEMNEFSVKQLRQLDREMSRRQHILKQKLHVQNGNGTKFHYAGHPFSYYGRFGTPGQSRVGIQYLERGLDEEFLKMYGLEPVDTVYS